MADSHIYHNISLFFKSDYKVTEAGANNLRVELETTKQQLQETLDLCAQQETLLEDKVKELEQVDEQNR